MPNEIIIERLSQLNSEYRKYLESGVLKEIATTLGEAHDFTEDQMVVLENGFTLYLLFFFNLNDLSSFINTELGLPANQSLLLAHALHSALPEELQAEVLKSQEALGLNEVETTTLETPPAVAETSPRVTIPVETPIINPLRTMATDGKQVGYQSTEEPVYTSVQNAIINESKWGSEDGK